MTLAAIRVPPKSARSVREIVAAWRRLTGGPARGGDAHRRTLIACSGGADSSGLLLALAAGVPRACGVFVAAHIVHDLRAPAEAAADREAASELAGALGIPFASAAISVRREGANLEGAARRLRYAALADLAREHGCAFIATAHHAGDQLETVLMGLLRGAGPAGLAGVAPGRRLRGSGAYVIRPALDVGRGELQELCRRAGWAWREDATNQDATRLRAALRHGVVPALESIRPSAPANASRSARLLADAAGLVRDHARRLLASGEVATDESGRACALRWDRATIRRERAIVVGAMLRAAAAQLRGDRGLDRLGLKTLEPAIRGVRGRGTDPKRFVLRGIEVAVDTRRVSIRRLDV